MTPKLLVVLGPTAVGKTRFAVRLASIFSGEIISSDSRQVYKSMDIGTGKDLNDYKLDKKEIPHHLIDIVSPFEEYNLFRFVSDFNYVFSQIIERGNIPILVGGSAMYINSILQRYALPKAKLEEAEKFYENYSPEELKNILLAKNLNLHNTTDLTDRKRIIHAICISATTSAEKATLPDFSSLVIGIKMSTDKIKQNISARLKYRLEHGMIEETQKLVELGVSFEKLKYFGLEYKFLAEYLLGNLNYNDMHQKLRSAIFSFAKRQMTWFRKMEREGIVINWFEPEEFLQAENLTNSFLTDSK